jgi:hypothetical protein
MTPFNFSSEHKFCSCQSLFKEKNKHQFDLNTDIFHPINCKGNGSLTVRLHNGVQGLLKRLILATFSSDQDQLNNAINLRDNHPTVGFNINKDNKPEEKVLADITWEAQDASDNSTTHYWLDVVQCNPGQKKNTSKSIIEDQDKFWHLTQSEQFKKHKYSQSIERAKNKGNNIEFVPFAFSSLGILGNEATIFLNHCHKKAKNEKNIKALYMINSFRKEVVNIAAINMADRIQQVRMNQSSKILFNDEFDKSSNLTSNTTLHEPTPINDLMINTTKDQNSNDQTVLIDKENLELGQELEIECDQTINPNTVTIEIKKELILARINEDRELESESDEEETESDDEDITQKYNLIHDTITLDQEPNPTIPNVACISSTQNPTYEILKEFSNNGLVINEELATHHIEFTQAGLDLGLECETLLETCPLNKSSEQKNVILIDGINENREFEMEISEDEDPTPNPPVTHATIILDSEDKCPESFDECKK